MEQQHKIIKICVVMIHILILYPILLGIHYKIFKSPENFAMSILPLKGVLPYIMAKFKMLLKKKYLHAQTRSSPT